MNADAYLKRLEAQLKGFPPEVQAQVIDEIAAHIEAGENDPSLGQDAADRAERLERELGSPDDLGRRLRQVHRSGHWLDFALVSLPHVLALPLLPLLANWIVSLSSQGMIQSAQYASITGVSMRLWIMIQAGIVLISRWKGSTGVLIHWLTSLQLVMIGLLLSEIRWPWLPYDGSTGSSISPAEAVFWLGALALLLAWMIRVVVAQRSEPLLVILAVTPFLLAAANFAAGMTLLYYQINRLEVSLPVIGWFGLSQIVSFIWPALFFLPHQRSLRWAGLMLPVTSVIYYLWPYHAYPLVVTLYILPVLVVLLAWARDSRARVIPTMY